MKSDLTKRIAHCMRKHDKRCPVLTMWVSGTEANSPGFLTPVSANPDEDEDEDEKDEGAADVADVAEDGRDRSLLEDDCVSGVDERLLTDAERMLLHGGRLGIGA